MVNEKSTALVKIWRAVGKIALVLSCGIFLTPLMHAQTADELMDRLRRVEQKASLDDEGLKPWHMKLAVDLFDEKDALKEKGTIEEWWYSKQSYRVVYDFPSYASTEVHTAEGSFRTADKPHPPYFVGNTLATVIHPLKVLPDSERAIADMTPMLNVRTIGTLKIDCIAFRVTNLGNPSQTHISSENYCMREGTDRLVVFSLFESESVLRIKFGLFQEREVPMEQTIKIGTRQITTARIVQLQRDSEQYPQGIPHDGLVRYETAIDPHAEIVRGKIIKKVQPEYPMMSKMNHVAGSVVMAVVIDKTGHIREIEPVASPDPLLTQSATNAVKKWIYQPYLVDGVPTEVYTNVTVNYSLGGPR